MSNMLQRGTYTNELFYITFIFQELNVLASTEANLSETERNYLMEPTNGDPLLEILQTAVYLKDLKSALDLVNPHDLLACQDLLRKCQETHKKLIQLSTQGLLGQDMSENRSHFVGNTCIPSSESLFGLAYRFSSLDNAMIFIMIWAHLAILQPLISQAHSLVHLQTASPAEIFLESSFEDMEFEDPEVYADRRAQKWHAPDIQCSACASRLSSISKREIEQNMLGAEKCLITWHLKGSILPATSASELLPCGCPGGIQRVQ
ncbi:hypothetical protein N7540_002964 [Penicillium herquei]|nr:hypothetical protein N7540_002964 [Penicillium herquei]